jgi:hypothetical protein
MPWPSLRSWAKAKKRPVSQAIVPSSIEPSLSDASQTSQVAPVTSSNVRALPPEIWLQIIQFVPLLDLWFLRPTCHLFNKLAIVRVWHLLRDTEVGVRTYFKSEHDPLSHESGSSELLYPALPQNLSTDISGTIIDDPFFLNTTNATWRVSTERSSDCEQLRMSYRPFLVEIRFGSHGAGYHIEKPQPVRGKIKDFSRNEAWSVTPDSKSRSPKFAKLFSSKSSRRSQVPWPVYKGATPQWIVKYVANYGYGRNDEGKLVLELVKVTLLEVSLPVSQVVSTFIDALKYSDLISQEETSNDSR